MMLDPSASEHTPPSDDPRCPDCGTPSREHWNYCLYYLARKDKLCGEWVHPAPTQRCTLPPKHNGLHESCESGEPRPLLERMEYERGECERAAVAYAQRAQMALGTSPPDYGGAAIYAQRASAAHLCAVAIQRGLDGKQ